jgi:hypothetical protein
MFGKYNGFVSKARVSACMYFLVYYISVLIRPLSILCANMNGPPHLGRATKFSGISSRSTISSWG